MDRRRRDGNLSECERLAHFRASIWSYNHRLTRSDEFGDVAISSVDLLHLLVDHHPAFQRSFASQDVDHLAKSSLNLHRLQEEEKKQQHKSERREFVRAKRVMPVD